MTFIPIPNGAKVVCNYSFGTKTWSNTLYFVKASFTGTDLENLADLVDARQTAYIRAVLDSSCNYVSTVAYDMRSSDGQVVTNTDSAGAGSASGDILPLSVAFVVTLRTAYRGRSARGRWYFSGLLESNVTDGEWNGTVSTFGTSYLDTIISDAAAQGWTMVIASRQQDGVVLEEANVYPVTSTEKRNNTPGTQRRRLARE